MTSQIPLAALPDLYDRFVQTALDVLRGGSAASELAAIGHKTFVDLFSNAGFRQELQAAIKATDEFRIEVVGDPHLFPWNFLHINGESAPGPEWFWGVRARVKRSLVSREQTVLPAKVSAGRPLIQIGLDSSLTHASQMEVPHIENLDPEHARTSRLPSFDSSDRHAQTKRLRKELIDAKANIIHFACHGDKGGDGSSASFTIDANLVVKSDILFGPDDKITSGPFVFLNACQMAADALDRDQAFIQTFLKSGARAVLAPECHVSDEKSAAFACLVYDKMIRNKLSLADSVRDATREMLVQNDLVGLMYTIHGQSDVQLASVPK